MTIQKLFITSNQALGKVIAQIKDDQWGMQMPAGTSSKPNDLASAVRYHTYDDAWIPDMLAGRTIQEVGDIYEPLLSSNDIKVEYAKYNESANNAVADFTNLDQITHLSYGDFPARDYLQHIISFRAFRSYDIAKMIGADTTMSDDFVAALTEEFSPVVELYRQMGVFPPAIEVSDEATSQQKLLAMFGRN